jgi:hypothetical protein
VAVAEEQEPQALARASRRAWQRGERERAEQLWGRYVRGLPQDTRVGWGRGGALAISLSLSLSLSLCVCVCVCVCVCAGALSLSIGAPPIRRETPVKPADHGQPLVVDQVGATAGGAAARQAAAALAESSAEGGDVRGVRPPLN